MQHRCVLVILLWALQAFDLVKALNNQNGRLFSLSQRRSFARAMSAAGRNEAFDSATTTPQSSSTAESVGPLRMQSQSSADPQPPLSSPPSSKTTKSASPDSLIRVLSTPAEFFDTIAMSSSLSSNNSKNFLVVNYHASYCKQCHRTSPALKKLANPYQDDFDFARVEAKVLGSDALRKLGIMAFPFFQIYYKGWCVASFSTGSGPVYAFEKLVSTTLDQCRLRIRSPEAWQTFFQQFEIPIRETNRALEELRPLLLPSDEV